jgi:hypothetical protein
MNNKKSVVVEREVLDIDEEEVKGICSMGKVEDILRATYERKTKGHGFGGKEVSPFQI